MAAASVTRPRLRRNSEVIARAQGERIKALQEGVGGIRDVLLNQSQPVFMETFEKAEAKYRNARTKNTFLAGAPRYVVETASLILIALVVIVVTERAGGLSTAVPVLGVFALGAKKLMPLLQQVYNGWAKSMGSRQVLFDLAALLSRSAPKLPSAETALPFETAIVLDNVGFSYTEDRGAAVSAVSVDIPKGARVGLAGKTGSGKSTLMDLILGLLEPSEGEIRIDGVRLTADNRPAWQMNIAHVPQFIYLSDASIAENIAFGVRRRDIDMAQVRRAAEQAELAEVVAALPKGYDTRIGERGIQLSGGQRQRIGIARALYKQASVLVFDEATSALDTETETAVMEAIDRLDRSLTILIIAHRLSTLEGCDFVLQLDAGRLAAIESKRELPRGTRAAG
jgi:ATP-binding cassette, subfamily B, bacterial PglK